MNMLLDALGDAGYALDTPGALLRGLLAGNPGSRASGTDLLDAYGLPGGPVGGFAAEMVLDPLALAGPALGAFRGLRGLSHADDAAPLMRRLGELGGSVGGGLDRRLADLAGHADPMDALRAGYRSTVGKPSPIADVVRGFGAGQEGYLRFPIPGVDPDLAAAMDGLGPQYPGGVAKLHGLAADALGSSPIPGTSSDSDSGFRAYLAAKAERPAGTPDIWEGEERAWLEGLGRTANPTGRSIYSRLGQVAAGPHGEQVASEIPEGSKFLGAGAEGLVVRTPDGGVIRIADRPFSTDERADIPEMLQAYRVAQAGPYKVEHLPFVRPVAGTGDELEGLAEELRGAIGARGFDPWDVTAWNTSLTPEGRAIVHDGGAVRSNFNIDADGFVAGTFAAPKPTYPVPEGDFLTRVLAAGGPEKVRESLRRGLAEGTRGQGVDSPYLEGILRSLGIAADPMDALRADYRGTVGTPTPIGDAVRGFLGAGEAGEFGGIDLSAFGRGRAPFTPDEVLAATGRRASHLGIDEAKAAYQPWVDSLLPEERSAVKMFTSGPQAKISHTLRRGSELAGGKAYDPFADDVIGGVEAGTVPIRTPEDVISEVVPYLDSALSRTAAPKDLMTYRLSRRIGDMTPANARERIGDVVSDPSYMSTTVTPWRRFYGADPSPNNLLMDILVPRGGKGGYADAISSWSQEKELLLPRDLPMRVADVRQVPAFKADYEWHRLDPEGRPIPKLGHSGNPLFRDVPDDEIADWSRQGVYGDVRVPDEFLAPDWRERLDQTDLEPGSITNVLLEALGGGPSPHLPAVQRRPAEDVWGELARRMSSPDLPIEPDLEPARASYLKQVLRKRPPGTYPDSSFLGSLGRYFGIPTDDLLRSIPRPGA